MNRFYTFLAFSIYQLILLLVALPIIAFIVYTLSVSAPVQPLAVGGELPESLSFHAWLYGSGDYQGMLNGDAGTSFRTKQPVSEMLNQRWPASLELLQYALYYSVITGVPLGIVLVLLRHYLTDAPLSVPVNFVSSIPVFCLAPALILVFAIQRGEYPVGGRCGISGDCTDIAARWPYLTLPLTSLTLVYTGGIALFVRDAIVRFSRQEATRRLTLRQVIAGVLTFTPGAVFGALVGMVSALVVIEVIFSYPGVGRLMVEAAASRDVPVMIAILFIIAVGLTIAYTLAIMLSALMMALIPPRLRDGETIESEIVPESASGQRFRQLSTAGAVVAAMVLTGIAVVCFTVGGDALRQEMPVRLSPPMEGHPWGTDELGRDYQARVLQGGQPIFINGVLAAVIGLIFTFVLGLIGGLFGGGAGVVLNTPVNLVLMVLQSFAPLLFLLVLVAVAGLNVSRLPLWLALLCLPQTVPIVRSSFQAMRAGRHIPLPAAALYVLSVVMARAMLILAMLDFLGMGTPPPQPSWGGVLGNVLPYLKSADYLLLPPIALLTVTLFCLTVIAQRTHDSFTYLLLPDTGHKAKRADELFKDVRTADKDELFSDVGQ